MAFYPYNIPYGFDIDGTPIDTNPDGTPYRPPTVPSVPQTDYSSLAGLNIPSNNTVANNGAPSYFAPKTATPEINVSTSSPAAQFAAMNGYVWTDKKGKKYTLNVTDQGSMNWLDDTGNKYAGDTTYDNSLTAGSISGLYRPVNEGESISHNTNSYVDPKINEITQRYGQDYDALMKALDDYNGTGYKINPYINGSVEQGLKYPKAPVSTTPDLTSLQGININPALPVSGGVLPVGSVQPVAATPTTPAPFVSPYQEKILSFLDKYLNPAPFQLYL